jgi:hypothetical protein
LKHEFKDIGTRRGRSSSSSQGPSSRCSSSGNQGHSSSQKHCSSSSQWDSRCRTRRDTAAVRDATAAVIRDT